MKHKILILIITVLGLTSCGENYLEVQHYFNDMLTVDSVFTNQNYSEQWLWSTYSVLQGTGADISNKGYQGFNFASDDAICGDRNGLCQRYQNCEYTASSQINDDRWAYWYQGIRKASIFINNIDNCKKMSMNLREDYRAQARFLRAYFYMELLKQYGPVPIMPEQGQDVSLSYEDLSVARSTYDECVEYIVAEFAQAARVLPIVRSSSVLGQATKGAALAARAKLLLYAASPLYNGNIDLFNLKDNKGKMLINQKYDETKWARAAAAAKEVIDLGVYDLFIVPFDSTKTDTIPATNPQALYPDGCGGIDSYESYRQIFNGEVAASNNRELIFFRQNYGGEDLTSIAKHSVPFSLKGWNTNAATQKQVDAYYMCDGKSITNSSVRYPYSLTGFTSTSTRIVPTNVSRQYVNREPRFYASIAFNGSKWENLSTTDVLLKNKQVFYYKGGSDGKLLSAPNFYVRTGIGIKKYYNPEDSWTTGGITTYKYEPAIRYADVLLWYAEALNEITEGTPPMTFETYDGRTNTIKRDVNEMRYAFKRVRFRAGLPDLSDGIYDNQNEFRNSLKRERQIEFFFEASRYFDLRRWKDAEVEENKPIMGCNIDMKVEQRDLYYQPTASFMPKLFLPKMYLWPLPADQLEKDMKLTQNPGW